MDSFGERISKLRLKKGLSQSELADRLSIAKSTLAMYETDKREPSFEITKKIAAFFEVSTDFLLIGKNTLANASPEETDFIEWVKENVDDAFFYNFDADPKESKRQMMEDLRYLYERDRKKRDKE